MNQAILLRVIPMKFGGSSKIEAAADEAASRFRTEPKTHRKRAVLVITDKTGGAFPNEMAIVRNLWGSDAVLSELILDRGAQTKLLDAGTNGIVDKTGGATVLAGKPGDAFRDSVH